MKFKNIFSIFLILVLVSISVYYVVGGVNSGSFTTPSSNSQFINGNSTLFFTLDGSIANVSNWSVFNVTDNTVAGVANTIINDSQQRNLIINLSYFDSKGNAQAPSIINFTLATGNFTTGIKGRNDGNYTFMIMFANQTGGLTGTNFSNITVLIDNNPPRSLVLVYPLNKTFTDNSTIQFGFNVSDTMSGNYTRGNTINCTFSINGSMIAGTYVNRSIVVINTTETTPVTSTGGAAYWFNVSSLDFDAGYHVWNISCVDFNNNVNSSVSFPHGFGKYRYGGNFTLTDTQGPTTSTPTLSASSVTDGTSVTVTCTGTDSITSDPLEYVSIKGPLNSDWQGDLGTSPYAYTGTSDVGTYTTRCRSKDSTGNWGGYSSEVTFAVTKTAGSTSTSTSGGSSGGSPAKETTVVSVYQGQSKDLGNLNEVDGVINAYQSSTVTFTTSFSSETTASSHSIKFNIVDYIKGEVTFTISSTPTTVTMRVGETKRVDMDGDGVDDLEITLNSIDENGQVNMSIRDVAITETTPAEETPEEVASAEPKGAKGGAWIWWVLIIIVIVVIVALLIPKKGKRK